MAKTLEELGYTLIESTSKYVRYKKDLGGGYEGQIISFDLKNKRVRISKDTLQNAHQVCYATLEELQAIMIKCKELFNE